MMVTISDEIPYKSDVLVFSSQDTKEERDEERFLHKIYIICLMPHHSWNVCIYVRGVRFALLKLKLGVGI